jgi:lipopolysaccharide transport system permease protein
VPESRYMELVGYKVFADLRAEARQTYLNFLWWVIEPVLYMTVFYVVFGLLLKRGGGPEYIPFLLCGLTAWRWFDNSVRMGAKSIITNAHLMRQVYLPKIVFPVIAVIQSTLKFVCVLLLLLIFLQIIDPGVSVTYLALPAVMLVQFLFICFFTLALAAVVPFLPDIGKLIGNALTLLMFLSGIFYTGKDIPEAYKHYFYMNPMATLLESYREILLYSSWPDWRGLFWIAAISCAGLLGVIVFFRRYDRVYPKILT